MSEQANHNTRIDLTIFPKGLQGLEFAGLCECGSPVFLKCAGCGKHPRRCDCGSSQRVRNKIVSDTPKRCVNHLDLNAGVVYLGKPVCDACYRAEYPGDPLNVYRNNPDYKGPEP